MKSFPSVAGTAFDRSMTFAFARRSVISSNAPHLRAEVKSCHVGSSEISPNPRARADEIQCTERLFLIAKQLFLICIANRTQQELFHSLPV
jgi:hypothetical protein